MKSLFSFPLKHCPDVLLLALLQINVSKNLTLITSVVKRLISVLFSLQPLWHSLRNELVSELIPVFLANHPNSGSVLHYVWHGQVWNKVKDAREDL